MFSSNQPHASLRDSDKQKHSLYSYLPNKRAGPNKRVGWKICQNQKINRIGLNNRVGWKNAKNSG